ncbi:MAG TPA: hypothetical protein VIU87_02030 [Mycobacterium sp.]
MGNAKYIGRVGALAAALGVGNVRRAATRMTVSIGAAVLVMATVVPVSTAASTAPCTQTDVTCALIMGTSGVPTPDDFYVGQEPVHRADSSGPHRIRQSDDARGVVARRAR